MYQKSNKLEEKFHVLDQLCNVMLKLPKFSTLNILQIHGFYELAMSKLTTDVTDAGDIE